MPNEPEIKGLSYRNRKAFFFVLVFIFFVSLPAMIFYTTGHRIDFENEDRMIITTGGMYVTTDNLEVNVFLDGESVERPRLFRSAYYVQNIDAGMHRVVVQNDGLTTWVKELPVDPYIVIEAAAFNMPQTPQLRPIAQFIDEDGTSVYFAATTTTNIFEGVTTTEPYRVLTERGTSSIENNEEYDFVASLFSTSTASTTGVFSRILQEVERFGFATTSPSPATSTFIERGNMQLHEIDNELFAIWDGDDDSIPYYFCVTDTDATTTAERYGDHVAVQVAAQKLSTSTPLIESGNYVCRDRIKIDRLRQDVSYYDFFPNSTDLLILQLEDGLYVTEIDDRAWQNTQRIYASENFKTLVHNDVIYIEDNGRYFELVTEIEE